MQRLRTSHGVTTSAPLSEPSQRITAVGTDLEKSEEVRVETHETPASQTIIVETEDEKFEWREVMRGMYRGHVPRSAAHMIGSGVKDPQVWMTALSYLGIIVSLYSFSLFLCVARFSRGVLYLMCSGPVSVGQRLSQDWAIPEGRLSSTQVGIFGTYSGPGGTPLTQAR